MLTSATSRFLKTRRYSSNAATLPRRRMVGLSPAFEFLCFHDSNRLSEESLNVQLVRVNRRSKQAITLYCTQHKAI